MGLQEQIEEGRKFAWHCASRWTLAVGPLPARLHEACANREARDGRSLSSYCYAAWLAEQRRVGCRPFLIRGHTGRLQQGVLRCKAGGYPCETLIGGALHAPRL